MHSFRRVLTKKQSRYVGVIAWLGKEIQELGAKKDLCMPRGIVGQMR